MFIGEYSHNLDAKGRLAVPAKFRSKLNDGAVVTKGFDNCLFLYSKDDWEKKAAKYAELPIGQSKARAFSRLMLAGAMSVEFDSQGRIKLPDYLVTYAKLDKKVIVAGLYDRLEIWDDALWSEYKTKAESESTEIAETMGSLGI